MMRKKDDGNANKQHLATTLLSARGKSIATLVDDGGNVQICLSNKSWEEKAKPHARETGYLAADKQAFSHAAYGKQDTREENCKEKEGVPFCKCHGPEVGAQAYALAARVEPYNIYANDVTHLR